MAAALSLARLARRAPRFSLCITPAVIPASTPPAIRHPATSFTTSAVSASQAEKSGGWALGGKRWRYERLVTVALVGLVPAAFIYPCAAVNYGLGIVLPMHGYFGFESVIDDYASKTVRMFAYPLLVCVTIGTGIGLAYLNYYDVGICKAVQILWALK